MLVLEQTPSIRQWAEQRLQCQFNNCITLAEYQNGKLIAVVVLSDIRKTGCELSIATASPKWASKRFLKEIFNFCFNRAKYNRVTALTITTNKKAIQMLERLGFKREGMLRQASDNGSDLWIYGMLKTECRWLSNGK